jgi:Flavoprotein
MGCLPDRHPGRPGFPGRAGTRDANGAPVRSEYRKPGDVANGRALPKADAIIVAPATYNTINKWANGISDNFALGILAEAIGLHTPVVVLPFVNSALAAHPAFQHSVAILGDAGIDIIHGPGRLEAHPPGTGGSKFDAFPWHQALDQAETNCHLRDQPGRQQQDVP